MISVWHLLWIIPLSISLGVILISMVIGGGECEREYNIYQEGYMRGLKANTVTNSQEKSEDKQKCS